MAIEFDYLAVSQRLYNICFPYFSINIIENYRIDDTVDARYGLQALTEP